MAISILFIQFLAWGSDDDRALMEKVKAISNANDKANFKTRLKQVNWKQIAFKKFSPKDCEDRFNSHLRRVRRYRTLNEIIDDIEVNIKKSRAAEGLSAYHVFVKEQLANAKSGIDFVSYFINAFYRDIFGSFSILHLQFPHSLRKI